MKLCWVVASLLALCRLAGAQDPSYEKVARERAGKIVAALDLAEPANTRVTEIVARQYRELERLQRAPAIERERLHRTYLSRLAAELSPEQVEKVKDGMTYGVVPLTFRVYQKMFPALSQAQKQQILTWLKEARELAMDEGTSRAKHAMFGRYKGRINNYLVRQGYDLKDGERNLRSPIGC